MQGLMYLKILVCVATQCLKDKQWATFQDSEEYLYGLNEQRINIYKCPSRGSDFVDKEKWDSQYEEEEMVPSNKVNKGGVVSSSYQAPIEINFITPYGQTKDMMHSKKIIKVTEKEREMRLTQQQIDKRRGYH